MGRKKLHQSNSEKTKTSNKKWTNAGNKQLIVWIPANADAHAKIKECAAQLRRDAGTMLPDDLVF